MDVGFCVDCLTAALNEYGIEMQHSFGLILHQKRLYTKQSMSRIITKSKIISLFATLSLAGNK
jgi:hypothetical protein